MSSFYLTTTLPYVNAEPHIGFALEIVAADVLARYHALLGEDVFFNTGTDEHGQKIYDKALSEQKEPQAYVDFFAQKFKDLQPLLALSDSIHFVRTTDEHHKSAAQAFWQRCAANINPSTGESDIYKAEYETLYCVGCELEKQQSDLVEGRCPLHPTGTLEVRKEENYFFRFSRYQKQLLALYENNPTFVQPAGKMSEITAFVAGGLQDFSTSRLKSKMPWGITVPGDSDHVMYVWFDALINYISTLGWPENEGQFAQFWPGIQLAGKDNLRQQAAMWQAMLFSAQLPNSTTILINGFISVDGQKMSKSLGNVISPTQMVDRYGTEATRFLLMSLGPFSTDMDVTWEKFDTTYTSQLSNRLGNWCSRIAKMCEKSEFSFSRSLSKDQVEQSPIGTFSSESDQLAHYHESLRCFDLQSALSRTLTFDSDAIFSWLKQTPSRATLDFHDLDDYLAQTQPWKLEKAEAHAVLQIAVAALLLVAHKLQPFMPQTATTICEHFSAPQIVSLLPLFPRLEKTHIA